MFVPDNENPFEKSSQEGADEKTRKHILRTYPVEYIIHV